MTGRIGFAKLLLSASAAILLSACGGGAGESKNNAGEQPGSSLGGDTVVEDREPDSSDPQPAPACSKLVECFDLTHSHVTPYKDYKQAAASYTFDDGTPSTPQIATLFEEHGYRATFYINAGLVAEQDWPQWGQLARKGHEIGNHSWTHAYQLGEDSVTDEQLTEEIHRGQTVTEEKIGIRPMGFAFPWHSYNQRALDEAYKSHFAVRLREYDMGDDYHFAFFDNDISRHPNSEAALSHVNQQLQDAVNSGGWFVAAGHGIDGDGWSPISSQFLKDHLDLADSFKSRLWVDTHLNVERYRRCRTMVDPEITIHSTDSVLIRLRGNYNAAFCTEPLTLAIPILKTQHATVSAFDEDGQEVRVTSYMDKLLLNITPGQTVSLRIAQ